MIWLAVAMVLAICAWPFVRERLHRDERPLTADWCRVCERELRRGEVWEVRTGHEAAEDGAGGTYVAITYCRQHKPRNARRA